MPVEPWVHGELSGGLARRVRETDPESLSGPPLEGAGGRGAISRVEIGGRPFLLKRERRGGMAGRFLPDLYRDLRPFAREWEVARRLAALDLTPPLAARWFVPRAGGFRVWTLLVPAEGARSLLDLLREEGLTREPLEEAGGLVGRLHGFGLLHGDLNAGNLIRIPEGVWRILDLRHSGLYPALPGEARRANLLRLARSLHKSSLRFGLPLDPKAPGWLLRGYGAGFGVEDPWLPALEARIRRGFPVRSLLYR